MSKIIFNEQQIVNKVLNGEKYDIDDYKVIQILIKYYYLKGSENKLDIREKTIEAMLKSNEDFNRANWTSYIDKSIEKMLKNIRVFGKTPKILNIEKVDIYKEELDYIDSFKYNYQRKSLFTLLVYAKMYNQMLDGNEGWISENFIDILKESKCQTKNNQYRLELLKELKDMGAINVFFKKGNCHTKVNYLKEDGEKVLEVDDFNGIIYFYLKYKGERWTKCEHCGKYFKITNKYISFQKYCSKCKKVEEREKYKKYNKKRK